MFGAAKLGFNIWIATPEFFEPKKEVVDRFIEFTEGNDGQLHLTHDPVAAAKDADVIYTDVWASMGQEGQFEERKRIFIPYQVNKELVRHAKKDFLFMHCLPAKRGLEVTDEVIDSPNSIVFDQAENRLHIQKAIMVYLMADPMWYQAESKKKSKKKK
jgi:ornithine carbamoyltransferase